MNTVILLLVSCFLTFFFLREKPKLGLKLSFVLIFIFLSLRYNFGNDYSTYLEMFNIISKSEFSDLFNPLPLYEPGWVLLNFIFRYIGFFALNIFISFITCFVFYDLISKHVDEKYYFFAIFLYVITPGFMLIHSTAMRQHISILIFVFSYKFLINRSFIKYLICCFLAFTFHYSAIILLPVYLILYFKNKHHLIKSILIFNIFIILILFAPILSTNINSLVSSFSEIKLSYNEASVTRSGLGFLYYSVILILMLYFRKFQNSSNYLFFKLSILGFLLIPLPLIINMLGRLILYFSPAYIIAFSLIIKSIKRKELKLLLMIFIICITFFQFFHFIFSDIYNPFFYNYRTIFSSDTWQ